MNLDIYFIFKVMESYLLQKMSKVIGESESKNLSGKDSQNVFDHAKQSATGAFTPLTATRF